METSLTDLCAHVVGQSQKTGKQTRRTAVMSEHTAFLLQPCWSFTALEHHILHLPYSKNMLQAAH